MSPDVISYTSDVQDQLEKFFREAWAENGINPFDPENAHTDIRKIPTVYQVNRGNFWLLILNKEIIATVAIKSLQEEIAEVKRLNVLKNYRGKGYGDLMFRRSIKHAMENDFELLRLDSIRVLGPALHLYQKYGFREIPRYNQNPNADVFMELDLRKAKENPLLLS